MKVYKIAATGGTFDYLHAGHKEFLKNIFNHAEKVVVGLTSDAYVQKNKPDKQVAGYSTRKKELEDFFSDINVAGRVEIISIEDKYGPLLDKDFKVDALAIAAPTKNVGEEINKKRVEQGMFPLPFIEVSLETAEDGDIISATRIRNGEVNRNGSLYIKKSWEGKNLLLPSTLRKKLQDVWGEVVENIPENLDLNKIITVGDITTKKFIENQKKPFLAIIDNKVERKDIPLQKFEGFKEVEIKNPAGSISNKLIQEIQQAFFTTNKKLLIIEGEEDLSVLPALLCAPLGFSIFYGQPGVGMVKIEVTEEIKQKAYDLVDSFEVI